MQRSLRAAALNEPLSKEAYAQVRSFTDSQRIAIAEMEDELSKLQVAAARVQAQLDDRKQHLQNFLQTNVRPIVQAPEDVLRIIFDFCVPTNFDERDLSTRMGAKHVSIVLSHVCRSWRTITMSAPRLWSFIHILVDPYIGHDARRQGRWVHTALAVWLNRSRSHPLTLHIQYGSKGPDNGRLTSSMTLPYQRAAMTSIENLLSQSSKRWERFSGVFSAVNLSDYSLIRILKIPGRHLPLLRKVKISFPQPRSTHRERGIRLNFPFADAPLLQHLSLELHLRAQDFPTGTWIPPRYDHLIDMRLQTDLSDNQVLHILQNSPRLENCQLTLGYQRASSIPSPTSPISLSHLTSLTLEKWPPGEAFFSHLKLPNMRHVSYRNLLHSDDPDGLFNGLQRHGGQLESFSCDPSFLKPSGRLAETLALLPCVRRLGICPSLELDPSLAMYRHKNESVSIPLLRLLSTGSRDDTSGTRSKFLCPQLEELICGTVPLHDIQETQDVMEAFLLERCRQSDEEENMFLPEFTAIKEFRISFLRCDGYANEVAAAFARRIKQKGVSLSHLSLDLLYDHGSKARE